MYNVSVPMALVDYIPVFFFGAAALILQFDLYGKMPKYAFATFAAGTINIFMAGFLKATWKLLYGAGICDFQALNTLFLPLQSLGFLLAGLGLILMLTQKKSKKAMLAVAPPVFGGTFVFIMMMVLGLAGICTALSIVAVKMKKKHAVIFFVLSFVCSMGMGYMASHDSTSAMVNWIEQGINCVGQGMMFVGAWTLHKNGLKEFALH